MPAALLTQGRTDIRDSLKTLVTHVVVTTDSTAFSAAHTGINPAAGSTSTHVGTSSEANVDGDTFDATTTINGTTEFTGLQIWAIGAAKGTAIRSATGSGGTHTGGGTVGTDTLSRTVRSVSIGVQAGDVYTIGVRMAVADNS